MNPVMDQVEALREQYGSNEYDHDHNPTEAGFLAWLADNLTRARTEQARRTATLADLAAWADNALADESTSRQYIAEYLSEALCALADGGRPAPPPL